jgi:outer membrane protein assembly factor BamB
MPGCRAIAVMLLVISVSRADDWPQWLGPHRNALSTETVSSWSEPPVALWRQPVGEGHSAPVVVGNIVILHTKVKDRDEEAITAFDFKTGRIVWTTSYRRTPFTSIFGNGPRATPTVVDGRVFAFGVTGILSCIDLATGKLLWQIDTLKKYQAPNLFFGVSCSPLVEGNKVLVNVGGRDASIVAFATLDGKPLWHNLDDGASYSSPIALGNGAARQIIFLTKQGLVSVEPQSGKVFWKYPLLDWLSESSSTPVRAGDFLLASSITFGMVGFRLQDPGKPPAAKEVWKNPDLTCYFSTPVPIGADHVFAVTGTKPPSSFVQANLRCIEAGTGKVLWEKPKVGQYHASLVRTANDKVLMLEDSGSLVLLEADPKQYHELSRAKICGDTWAHPALSQSRLLVRDRHELICLQLKP